MPTAFSLTHINMTHRNWTAVGIPGCGELPIIDPAGLLTPFYDGWSIDAWVIPDEGQPLVPSREDNILQKASLDEGFSVFTEVSGRGSVLSSEAGMLIEDGHICALRVKGLCRTSGWLAVSLRPCNPEGVSFIHTLGATGDSWTVNEEEKVFFEPGPERHVMSNYSGGDVFNRLLSQDDTGRKTCDVGLCTAASLYRLEAGIERQIYVKIPVDKSPCRGGGEEAGKKTSGRLRWDTALAGTPEVSLPDKKLEELFNSSLKAIVLHSEKEIYPGPYTYKYFWFRDAVFILNAMLAANMKRKAGEMIDGFIAKQLPSGYFRSQEGEWDSNGQVLWIIGKYCEMTAEPLKKTWTAAVKKAARWIERKRLPRSSGEPHSGLLPAGFSAEHFGPNDYYYWDDMWAVAGLKSAAVLMESIGNSEDARGFGRSADDLSACLEKSLASALRGVTGETMPSSPYRRPDSASVGTLCVSYPLGLWGARDKRVLSTCDMLLDKFTVKGGFYHQIAHSGINAYLSLHIAQSLLRAGDKRYYSLVRAVADMASPTGQWPEAVHPATGGGCMGDGQHMWAAAEWVMMIRNMLVREEFSPDRLILCSGIPEKWLEDPCKIRFGPCLNCFGIFRMEIDAGPSGLNVVIKDSKWKGRRPEIYVHLPGRKRVKMPSENDSLRMDI
jgi:hypothetical protein